MPSIFYDSPIGCLLLEERDGCLVSISPVRKDAVSSLEANEKHPLTTKTPLLRETCLQLEQYFKGYRRQFDIPLAPVGTLFQRRVWEALCAIPYGKTVSYGDIARVVDSPRAFRAVGMACHNNPLMIVVPCHRVLAAGGRIGGYSEGLAIKYFLLRLEGVLL
ncbi:MAG: methylated-DNA--[Mailhella sp.]|nr:methylated-DNA--[protein]-cysteine S-methyltransferase [Mailhella sp.]MBQ8664397.1 methylated-DNA--[protein]-cysteine S-methyltransferase [Mailhella sp.]MBQ9105666.1 methylated-DNA--[protein]-cysteine S-methyltransferase [Mailhella sp.]